MKLLQVKKLKPSAVIPTRAHRGDLGFDLYCAQFTTIHPGTVAPVPTDIAVQFPLGFGGLIRDRSSVAMTGLFTVAGVIDNGYTGHIKVAMYNSTEYPIAINPREKFAQMVLVSVVDASALEVEELHSMDGRGTDGFGSSGQ